jgi:hypothetical protein
MRFKGVVLLAVTCLIAPDNVRAADRDKALAVVEQAIKAHGGAKALTKAQMRSRTAQGILALAGNTPFTAEEIVSLPHRSRSELVVGRNRQVLVLNGDKGWVLPAGGAVQEMTKELLAESREESYVWWLMTLVPLQKKEFELKPLADAKVNDRAAAVVKVSSKGHPDATLFFDKKTGLLVKISRRVTRAGLPIDKEYFYADHKDFDGAKLPVKELRTINGKKEVEVRFTACKLLSKIDDTTFGKP